MGGAELMRGRSSELADLGNSREQRLFNLAHTRI
jgi:hypothetical protein